MLWLTQIRLGALGTTLEHPPSRTHSARNAESGIAKVISYAYVTIFGDLMTSLFCKREMAAKRGNEVRAEINVSEFLNTLKKLSSDKVTDRKVPFAITRAIIRHH